MTKAGLRGLRPTYDFVLRAVAAESPTINRLAELLAVSKQAASKLVHEMHRAGLLKRQADQSDRRQTRLQLSRKGQAVRRRGLAVGRGIERSLRHRTSERDVTACRRVLIALIEQHGPLEDVLARRARPGL